MADAVGNRTIDALVISAGVNDIEFANVLTTAIRENFTNSSQRQKSEEKVKTMLLPYRAIAETITTKLKVRKVFITGYPSNIFG